MHETENKTGNVHVVCMYAMFAMISISISSQIYELCRLRMLCYSKIDYGLSYPLR